MTNNTYDYREEITLFVEPKDRTSADWQIRTEDGLILAIFPDEDAAIHRATMMVIANPGKYGVCVCAEPDNAPDLPNERFMRRLPGPGAAWNSQGRAPKSDMLWTALVFILGGAVAIFSMFWW